MDPEFISERQQALQVCTHNLIQYKNLNLYLQKYLNIIIMNPILVSSLPARSFIDPANYCQPFRGKFVFIFTNFHKYLDTLSMSNIFYFYNNNAQSQYFTN